MNHSLRAVLLIYLFSLVGISPAQAFDSRTSVPAREAGLGEQVARGSIEALFSPWNDIEATLLRALREAKKAIYVQAFSFTSRNLARALVDAHARGVKVEVLADREQTVKAENSQIPVLVKAGIPVALEVRYAAAHNKILLIDPLETNSVLVTGSYNFTYSAHARNAENVLVLRGNAAIARSYLDNWTRHHAEAVPYAQALTLER